MAHDVFISYSAKDKAVADAIVSGLEQGALRCWIAPRDVLPGTVWGEAIVRAIETSRVMVLVLSEHSNGSPQVLREVELAVANGTIVLPFRIKAIDPSGAMAYYLAAEHWLDALTPPLEDHVRRLVTSIRALLTGERAPSEMRPAASPIRQTVLRRPVLAAGLAVAALAAAGVFLVALGGKGPAGVISDRASFSPPLPSSASPAPAPTPSPAPTTTPVPPAPSTPTGSLDPDRTYGSAAAVEELKTLLPADISRTCVTYDIRGAMVAAVECDRPGGGLIWYERFPDLTALREYFALEQEVAGIESETGSCKAGEEAEFRWSYTPENPDDPIIYEGHVLCSKLDSGGALLEYTAEAALVIVTIVDQGGRIDALWTAWSEQDIDPVVP